LTVKYSNPYVAQKIADETANIFSMEAANLLNVTNVNILSKAKVESTPTSPKPKLYLAISIVIGLILGLALALLKEVFDNKINKEEDIEALGLSVLGVTAYAQTSDFSNPNYKKETLDSDTSMSPDEQELSRLSKRKKR
ncbi:GNVR domain-containing protein, partial [Leuconostoc falkenbergense]